MATVREIMGGAGFMRKAAKNSKSLRISGKLFLAIAALITLALFLFSFTSCCNLGSLASRFIKTQDLSESNQTAKEGNGSSGSTSGAEEDASSGQTTPASDAEEAPATEPSGSDTDSKEYSIAYFEVTSSSESNHFEHRVGNIYAVSADGADKKLIYSDIENEYDLGSIFGASPDGTKILGMLADGGRGAYSAICIIDVLTGELTTLAEFDFTESESGEINLGLYGRPVWSSDSSKIAYEVTTNPYMSPLNSNFRDVGLFIIDVETGEQKEVNIDLGGASIRSTTFLEPVFFAENDSQIFMVSHPYYEKKENGETVGFYSLNDTLYRVGIDGGAPAEILGVGPGDFSAAGPEIISSFDNFRFIKSSKQIVFQVLGDFEEDGDLWVCNYDGSGLKRLTEDNQLREQQPSLYDSMNGDSKIAYTGSLRYGTISAQIPSGDIFIINSNGSGNKKLTDFKIGASAPVISPGGSSIAFLFSQYDESMNDVIGNYIMIYDLGSGSMEKISSDGYLINIAGWVQTK
jgi:Tol biopolymer transport system component